MRTFSVGRADKGIVSTSARCYRSPWVLGAQYPQTSKSYTNAHFHSYRCASVASSSASRLQSGLAPHFTALATPAKRCRTAAAARKGKQALKGNSNEGDEDASPLLQRLIAEAGLPPAAAQRVAASKGLESQPPEALLTKISVLSAEPPAGLGMDLTVKMLQKAPLVLGNNAQRMVGCYWALHGMLAPYGIDGERIRQVVEHNPQLLRTSAANILDRLNTKVPFLATPFNV